VSPKSGHGGSAAARVLLTDPAKTTATNNAATLNERVMHRPRNVLSARVQAAPIATDDK
jgi:hypothetical protein